MAYHQFLDPDGKTYGSFEVFRCFTDAQAHELECEDGSHLVTGAGWYWWPCFPGCLPDGDPSGPYATMPEAIAAAMDGA